MHTDPVGSHRLVERLCDTTAMPSADAELLPRDPDATDYLSQILGVRVTRAALEQHASRGTGPAFRIVLGRAVYSRAALDRWADEQLSAETPHAKRRRNRPLPLTDEAQDLDRQARPQGAEWCPPRGVVRASNPDPETRAADGRETAGR
jgi:hypothetical protein